MKIAFIYCFKKYPENHWEGKIDSMQHAIAQLSEKYHIRVFLIIPDKKGRYIINGQDTTFLPEEDVIVHLRIFKPNMIFLNRINLKPWRKIIKAFPKTWLCLIDYGNKVMHTPYHEKANMIIVQQDFQKQKFLKRYPKSNPDKVKLNQYCIETNIFKPVPVEKKYTGVMLADFRRNIKRQHLLIEAWKNIPGKLLLIGRFDRSLPKKYHEDCIHLTKVLGIDDRVTFMNGCPHELLPNILSAAKIAYMTSSREGGPRALLEMMACGLPAIVMEDCDGCINMVNDGVDGLVAKPDEEDIREKTLQLLEQYEEMGVAATENAGEFPYDKMTHVYEEIIEGYIEKFKPQPSTHRDYMKTIVIENARLENNGKRVVNSIKIPEALKKFFSETEFFVEYEEDVSTVPLSILNIPALASIIHLAWAIGYDVLIDEVDADYVAGLEKVRRFMADHPGFNAFEFTTRILVDTQTPNNFNYEKKGLLFSGGCDSTAAYIDYLDEKPDLIMIRGLDIPLEWANFWERVMEKYRWMNLNIITTNSERMYGYFVNPGFIPLHKAVKESYMPGYSFTVNRLGLCAPLTVKRKIGDLMLASTYPSREYGDDRYPWTMNRVNWIIDSYFKWGGIECRDVHNEYSSNQKVQLFLKPYFAEHGPLFLRSCGNRKFLQAIYKLERINCLECDKCERMFGMLTLYGINPNSCGFPVGDTTFARIQKNIINKRWNKTYLKYHWREIKQVIPKNIKHDFIGSKKFFEWLKRYKL